MLGWLLILSSSVGLLGECLMVIIMSLGCSRWLGMSLPIRRAICFNFSFNSLLHFPFCYCFDKLIGKLIFGFNLFGVSAAFQSRFLRGSTFTATQLP
jgi:hypothetical protein